MTDFVLDREHYVKNYKQLYIFFIFEALFWLSYMILMQMLMKWFSFINVANVYLTHNLLMNRLMCLSFWKCVDIE